MAARVDGTTVSVMAETRSEDFAYGAERFQEEARDPGEVYGTAQISPELRIILMKTIRPILSWIISRASLLRLISPIRVERSASKGS